MTTDNPTLQSEKLEPPDRVWLTRKEISGHQTWVQASGHDDGEYEYVRVPVAAQGDDVWCGNPACHFCRHRNLVPAAFAAPSPSSPVPAEQERGLWSEAASIVQACLNVHSTYSDAEREFASHLIEVFRTRDQHPDYRHRNTVRAYPAATPAPVEQEHDG